MQNATKDQQASTRNRLLRAAEHLFAEEGIGPASTRAILQRAGQRNESALQYHFGSRQGLLEALYTERGAQVERERQAMLDALDGNEDLRALCAIALMPAVRLARRDESFVHFLKVVGQLAFLPSEALQEAQGRYEGRTLRRLARRMEPHLGLPASLVQRRSELVTKMVAAALAQRALSGESFVGKRADRFFTTLLDGMAAVLEGPVSSETRAALSPSQRAALDQAQRTRRAQANRHVPTRRAGRS